MEFSQDLVKWYQKNKRPLPWREDKDPYHVWISEIMLQQTRIEAVIDYYKRFMKELPTISSLATVDENKLMKLWQGLGYYNRAKNLKKAAMEIEEKYHGVFPHTFEEIVSLPGIGEYTAGAISSICFQVKKPAVDGNVLRVMSRVYASYDNVDEGKTRKEVSSFLEKHMCEESGDFNEGIMELGETICLANTTPLCEKCPISSYCLGYQKGVCAELPIKNKKKKQKEETYTILGFFCDGKIAISKRTEGLLKNLYEFPNVEGTLSKTKIQKEYQPIHMISIKPYHHVFSHVIWNMTGYLLEVEIQDPKYQWVSLEELEKLYAIPTAFESVFKEIERYFHEHF